MNRPMSAIDRLEASLARIGSPDLEGAKVFTDIFAEVAREEAVASDKRRAEGRLRGPLDGRIVSVKCLLDVEGLVTHAGSAMLRRLPPAPRDAPVVRRLREAGAVVVGRTHMTEFAFSALGVNPHEPVPGNPHDRTRVPGGSSSGAVVSVVDGMAEIAIGSDTGGSIRIPSALSGAIGFKPTSGRVETAGAFSLSTTLDTLGPIATCVADCAAADAVLADVTNEEADDGTGAGRPRLIVPRGRLFDRTEPDVLDAFERALEPLRDADIPVEDGSLDQILDKLAEIDRIATFPSVEVAATLRMLGYETLDEADPKTRSRIEAGANLSAIDYVRITRLRNRMVEAFETKMGQDEVYVLPTTPIRAPSISSVAEAADFHAANGLVLRNPRIANMLDCPSVSLPLPIEGMPAGLMLIGRRGSDRQLLRFAQTIEKQLLLDCRL